VLELNQPSQPTGAMCGLARDTVSPAGPLLIITHCWLSCAGNLWVPLVNLASNRPIETDLEPHPIEWTPRPNARGGSNGGTGRS